jgi:hypothetical protein
MPGTTGVPLVDEAQSLTDGECDALLMAFAAMGLLEMGHDGVEFVHWLTSMGEAFISIFS